MPNGYDPSSFPTSYKDPAYDQADAQAAASVGIPASLLTAVRTKGEKSNADQISSAGASTVYQITPSTRQSIIDQTGIDPYLNPQTAAYGAAYLLKQNLDRNNGNPALAVASYAGGTDPDAWGPKTLAYTKRVTGSTPNSYVPGQTPNPFQVQPLPDIGAAPGSVGSPAAATPQGTDPYAVQPLPDIGSGPGAASNAPSALTQAYQAYKAGQMSPQDAAQFEQDVSAGRVVLPSGMDVKAPAPQPEQPSIMPIVPQQVVDAFNNGQMHPEDAAQFQKDIAANNIALPPGATLSPPQAGVGRTAGVAARGYLEGLGQGIGGVIDRAKDIIDAPMSAVNAIAGGQGGPLSAINSMFGTHVGEPSQPAPLAGAPNAGAQIPSMEQGAEAAANKLGLPVAQTPGEQVVQQGAQGAGLMTQPFPGVGLARLPAMVAAGTAGGAVGEQVHQATGSQALGLAANLLTTALSPLAASRVMKALVGEVGAREAATGTAERAEPTMQAQAPESAPAQSAAPKPAFGAEPTQAQGRRPTGFSFDENGNPIASTAAQPAAQEGAQATATPEAAPAKTATAEATPEAATGPLTTSGTYSDGGKWSAVYRTVTRTDGSVAVVRELTDDTGTQIQHLDQDGMWQKGEPAKTSVSGVTQLSGPETFQSEAAAFDHVRATENGFSGEATTEGTAAGQTETASATPLVPDDPEQRAEIIRLMQNASGQNRTITPAQVQAARGALLDRFQIDPQAVDAARELGMLDDLHPDHLATDIQMIKLNQLLKSDPSNPMAAQEAANLTRVGQRAIGLFNEMGAAPDISSLSQKANQLLGEQNASLKGDVHGILDNQIPSMVPRTSQVPATNSLALINQELENLGGKSQLLSRDWRRAQGLLSPVDEPVSVGGQQIPGSKVGIAPTNPTYHAIDTLRKQLNAADRGAGPFVNMEQASRRRLAQALSQDQGAYLQSASPDAHALWQQANAKVQMYKAVQDDMQTLFGKSTEQSMLPTLKNAIQGLQSGNVENFNRVVSAIPKSMRNEVLTTTLQNMFTRAGSNELGPFGFEQFSRFFKSFKQDSASYSALMANLDPEARATLSKLITVSNRISGSISQKIYTGRSRFAKDLVAELNDVPTTMIDRMRSAVGPAAGRVIGGAVGAAAHKVPVIGPAVLSPVAHGVGNVAAWMITPNKTPVEKALSDFILSDDAKTILEKGPAANDQQIRAAASSPTFGKLYQFVRTAAANDPVARENWLRGVMNAGGQLSESDTNKSR